MISPSLLYAFFFITGATGLVYQVAWARDLTQIFGSNHESISIVLGSFMCGLAVGSLAAGRYTYRVRSALSLYGLLELMIGVYAVVLPFLLNLVNDLYVYLAMQDALLHGKINLLRMCMIFALLVFPTSCMGASLPVMIKHFSTSSRPFASQLSMLYSVNTFGAVFGTLLCGFFLLPALGAWKTELSAAVCNIGIGLVCWVLGRRYANVACAQNG